MATKYTHIELFAGCGGMSLGLEASGFKLHMANELSPMAAETFAYNILNENLAKLADENKPSDKVLWIKSKFKNDDLKNRLRENPFQYSKGRHCDLSTNETFKNKLVVGNIDHFLNYLVSNKACYRALRDLDVDLLSGGPPCQGFSLVGKREKDDHKNLLPLSFAKFAGLVQPKVVVLENVRGITAPFETDDGVKHYAWLEVAKAFALKGFVPVCFLLNSKYFEVPQNRPRFILYAFRKDIFDSLKNRIDNDDETNSILLNALMFFKKVRTKRNKLNDIGTSDIKLYDIEHDKEFFNGKLLPAPILVNKNHLSASHAISDISSVTKQYVIEKIDSTYSQKLADLFKSKYSMPNELRNHEPRKHSFPVRARFRLYQILNNLNGLRVDAEKVISGKITDEEVVKKIFLAVKNEDLLYKNEANEECYGNLKNLDSFKEYLKLTATRKHSQQALKKNEPAPAQLTIPDDHCHYSSKELRTLTVREMARFQSFPDWFVFRSKVTTGGDQRSFEVPQYTQVGNAVPPLLAYHIGRNIINLLESITNE